jgi:hypothetical protein
MGGVDRLDPVLLVAHDTNMVVSTCSFRPVVFAIKSLLIIDEP